MYLCSNCRFQSAKLRIAARSDLPLRPGDSTMACRVRPRSDVQPTGLHTLYLPLTELHRVPSEPASSVLGVADEREARPLGNHALAPRFSGMAAQLTDYARVLKYTTLSLRTQCGPPALHRNLPTSGRVGSFTVLTNHTLLLKNAGLRLYYSPPFRHPRKRREDSRHDHRPSCCSVGFAKVTVPRISLVGYPKRTGTDDCWETQDMSAKPSDPGPRS